MPRSQAGARRDAASEPSEPSEPSGAGEAQGSEDLEPGSEPGPASESVARGIALRMLTGAARSRSQLAQAMARRGVDEATAERVLDRFEQVGLVDDDAFAAAFVRAKHADRGLARRALAVELRRTGIDDETAARALDGLDSEQEERTARALVQRKWSSTVGLDPERRRRRIVAMLGRKGYSPATALRLLREMRDDGGTSPHDVDGPWDS